MVVITNAFSLNMLSKFNEVGLYFKKVSEDFDEIKKDVDIIINVHNAKSFVGHKDLADMFNIPVNRENYEFDYTDRIFILQYVGPRLPEGTTILPDGAKIVLWEVVRYD